MTQGGGLDGLTNWCSKEHICRVEEDNKAMLPTTFSLGESGQAIFLVPLDPPLA